MKKIKRKLWESYPDYVYSIMLRGRILKVDALRRCAEQRYDLSKHPEKMWGAGDAREDGKEEGSEIEQADNSLPVYIYRIGMS